jgi:hypothetical protein
MHGMYFHCIYIYILDIVGWMDGLGGEVDYLCISGILWMIMIEWNKLGILLLPDNWY